ncbi:MAG TPA: TIGR01244 family sulfur transferase [Sphingomicrobium sp.]|nr:TIGR01244 family sulfur transferase [Sphingomicrobium sp.]
MIRHIDDRTSVSHQLTVKDIADLPGQGVTMLINNRPDGEDADQPAAAEIEAAAERAGLAYRHVPIIRGIGPGDVEAMQDALDEAGEGKVLAFCRSGNRSALVYALTQRAAGVPREEIERRLAAVGIDSGPIQHLL